MTLEEFIGGLKETETELKAEYTKKFGLDPPDLDELAFLGSKIDILKQAIDENTVIQDIIIPDGAKI